MITQYNQKAPRQLRKAKPFTLHCSLLLVVFLYAFFGGLIFTRLESNALERQKTEQYQEKLNCASRIINAGIVERDINRTVEDIVQCWAAEKDERSEWGYMTAWLYGFGICTTLGYNRIAPITTKGRLFCMLYGVIGIPMTMIIIANVGQYLREFAGRWRKTIEIYRARRRESKVEEGRVEDVEDASIEYVSIALLLVFSAYIALGAWLLPLLNGQIDFINGLYYNFLCLTAMDFGQLAPQK
uniref:Ion_trans_2 domain-containing protein n=1 Tax=Steinernema glaseri TaxID=37863 RepID=A0A1I7YYR3_9BILA